ncbi:helix-turn-helix transcriptional regulator [Streptomyces sp. NPDC048278]|uniref:helix-turn-helix domain-containing protein n=1 Tax=Streptomyces sp. NPDC048278 TaxID=3155809 RepID=UPI003437A0A5
MPGGNRRAKKPCAYVADGLWPHAVMDRHLGAQVAQAVARALAEAMERQKVSANALAQASDVNRQVIANVLAGTVWPDLLTVANLEGALGEPLWPNHLDWPQDESGRRAQPQAEGITRQRSVETAERDERRPRT